MASVLQLRLVFLIFPSSGSLTELNKFQIISPILLNKYNLNFIHIYFPCVLLTVMFIKIAQLGANSFYYNVL